MSLIFRFFALIALISMALPHAYADRKASSIVRAGGKHGHELRPYRFATLNLLPDEVALLHVDGYAPVSNHASISCQVRVAFVSEEVVLQEGTFTLSPNRTFDTAFYGPATGVVEFHPVITPVGPCSLDIVPLLQVQQRVPIGTGKTLYIYPGQFSTPLHNYGDFGSAPQ